MLSGLSMSGRDPSGLHGFGMEAIDMYYFTDSPKTYRPITKETMNLCLDLCSLFRLDRIEFFNAISIVSTLSSKTRLSRPLPLQVAFFAALRLSVFWRRRRDILGQNYYEVLRILQSLNCAAESVLDAESEILSARGCQIWDSKENLVEIVYMILERLELRNGTRIEVKALAVDICYLILLRNFIPHGSVEGYTVWYVNMTVARHTRFPSERALGAVCIAIAVLCKARDLSPIVERLVKRLNQDTLKPARIEKLSTYLLQSIVTT